MTERLIPSLNETAGLSTDEQLELAALLVKRARRGKALPGRRWLDVVGTAPYPLTGEDAQDWVTRTRQEGEDEREQQWRSSG
jgi:hypothetical protein